MFQAQEIAPDLGVKRSLIPVLERIVRVPTTQTRLAEPELGAGNPRAESGLLGFSWLFRGMSRGDAAFLYQCLTQQPAFSTSTRRSRPWASHAAVHPTDQTLQCLRPGQARRCLG